MGEADADLPFCLDRVVEWVQAVAGLWDGRAREYSWSGNYVPPVLPKEGCMHRLDDGVESFLNALRHSPWPVETQSPEPEPNHRRNLADALNNPMSLAECTLLDELCSER